MHNENEMIKLYNTGEHSVVCGCGVAPNKQYFIFNFFLGGGGFIENV